MRTSIARRRFLKQAGKTLGSAALGSVFADTLFSHCLSTAYAQALGLAPNPATNYIHLGFPGGPPRWMFDQLLTPSGKTGSNFVPGGFGTRFVQRTTGWTSEYAVVPFNVGGKTVHLPPVWKMNVGSQDFSSLLPHSVFVRGMDMEINNHELSHRRQVTPVLGGTSITGALADVSGLPIPSLADPSSPASLAFSSRKGYAISSINLASANPAAALLEPFKDFRLNRPAHTADRTRLQSQALAKFEEFAKATGIAESAMGKMYDNAIRLMDEGIVEMANNENWNRTVNEYKDLIEAAIHPAKGTLPGLYDKAIPGAPAGTKGGLFSYDLNANTINLSDIRDIVQADSKLPRMAENFALAELMLGTVTSSMTLAFPPQTVLHNSSGPWTAIHDQHFVGSMISTLQTTLFYRAFLACLSRFVERLKANGRFERTVIHISSEFSRTPRTNGSGSDHGYMAGNATLISGMINQLGVVGNIKVVDPTLSSVYGGTFGVGDIYDLDGFNRPIQVNDVALTITSMLGVDKVVTNGRSLLTPASDGWVLRKEEAKNNA